ncbi:MAG: PhzF family phenazine biosynthesis protein, partial [bacterium]|nr:PhzF family phenazine biosynthesis protein [bacterium]
GAPWPTAQIDDLLGLQLPRDLKLPPVQMMSLAQPILLVPVPGLQELGTCRLDGPAFRGLAVRMVRHQALHLKVYVFCLQARDDSHHVAARMFRPDEDGPEDAASCDAAACLGAYLLQHKLLPDGTELLIEQGYETGRPSLLRLRVQMQMAGPRIEVGGVVRPHYDDDNTDRKMLPR